MGGALMAATTRCSWCGEPWRVPSLKRCLRCGHRSDQDDAGNGIGHGSYGLMLMGLAADQHPTGFEGQHLKAFDPTRPGRTPNGDPIIAHIETTTDPQQALRFADVAAARRMWMRWDGKVRINGKPSRPLTAFTIEVSRIPG